MISRIILAQNVMLRDGGKEVRVPRQLAIMKALADQALKDPRLAISLLTLAHAFGIAGDDQNQEALSTIDTRILDEFVEGEIAKRSPAAPNSEELP